MSQSIRFECPRPAVLLDGILSRLLFAARTLQARSPRAGMMLRRIVLVVWWTLTLQLGMQFGYWRRARRLRRTERPAVSPALIGAVDAASLRVPCAEHPAVSVIIPTYGKVDYTLRCLASIVAHAPDTPIEVIVVDDASPDPDVVWLARVAGIRLLRNCDNLGFVRACNAAARIARGDFLLFLNNDTQVLPGWLDSMLALFRSRDDVGAVGSQLLYPDGRLQEAGGIIWNDASGWNFGRHEDPDRPGYSYVREVDYCSGASLMVPRPLFARIGGFDERYVPAYFEDSDLCFRLRAMGLKTLYQPRSRVVHYEGVSHGQDVAVGVKSYQVSNRKTFLATWGAVLARDHYENGTHVMRARERARHRPVILVVDHMVPTPDRDAGSRTMVSFLKALVAAGLVVKFWPQNLARPAGYTEALQDMGIEVFYGAAQPSAGIWLREHGAELDAILLSRPDVADEWLPGLRQHTGARVVYYGHDLHFRRMRLQGEVMQDEAMLRAADRMEERERAIWRKVDAALYPSDEEASMVAVMEPSATPRAVVPYGFESFAAPRSAPPDREILFVAGFGHPPNEEAACWFVRAVLPMVRARVPDARLAIVGSNPTDRVRALVGDAVQLYADVSDAELADWYSRARVAVVPLRCGAGVKLKVVEALCEGLPLVTTVIGAQGLPDLASIVPVESHPAAFARAVCALLLDDELWQRRSADQLGYARARFQAETLSRALLDACGIALVARLPMAA
ncbi:MAG: glycosyltransferase [Acetobacteraceae bacterium]|nr:glycosyltransferase [Acetobacteraceae bacterium]